MYWMNPCTAEASQHQSIKRKRSATRSIPIYTTLETLYVKSLYKYAWFSVPVCVIDLILLFLVEMLWLRFYGGFDQLDDTRRSN